MGEDILTRADMASRSGAPESNLEAWTKAKLLKPVGFADEGMPLYAAADLDLVSHIARMAELGYGLEEIARIIKKFGVPHATRKPEKPAAEKFLTVGQLAERTELSPRTIKHWEEIGIIEPDMRSGGGFRLYAEIYVPLCLLIRDLQLFGYSLEEIKADADHFREFLSLQKDLDARPAEEAGRRIEALLGAVEGLRTRMKELKGGIERWDDLLKKKKKEIISLQGRNAKRFEGTKSKEKSRA